jgi:hypothetical protein
MLKMGKESEGGRRDAKGQNGEASNSVWWVCPSNILMATLNQPRFKGTCECNLGN